MSTHTDGVEKVPANHDVNEISQDDAERIIFLVGKIAEAKTRKHEVRLSTFLNKERLGVKPLEKGLQVIASWDRLERFSELLLDQRVNELKAQDRIGSAFLEVLFPEDHQEQKKVSDSQ